MREHLLKSKFLIRLEAPSRLAPGEVTTTWQFKCPSCSAIQGEPKHGIEGKCAHCDLHWISHGNGLDIWKATDGPKWETDYSPEQWEEWGRMLNCPVDGKAAAKSYKDSFRNIGT